MSVYARIRRWRDQRRARTAEEYANLSDQERADIARLRAQHDPLQELAQDRSGSAWGRMVEDEFKPRR